MTKLLATLTGPADPGRRQDLAGWGLLIMRVALGAMMLGAHGWAKLTNFSAYATQFPDPLGLGANPSLALAVFAEVFCSLAIILGLFTRWAAVPLIVTMLVAAAIVHADDPWQKKEFALLYLIPMLTLVFTGPGKLALDDRLRPRR
ncbi:DoxX family membrane protein [bacterium]|nr:DoxX family membrane protein [bacterium]